MTTATVIIQKRSHGWEQRCVYWSPTSDSLLIGMCSIHLNCGMVTRYIPTGELKQVIGYDNNRLELYRNPCFITENNNGDIVVSDSGSAVVVTDHEGKDRFPIQGHHQDPDWSLEESVLTRYQISLFVITPKNRFTL